MLLNTLVVSALATSALALPHFNRRSCTEPGACSTPACLGTEACSPSVTTTTTTTLTSTSSDSISTPLNTSATQTCQGDSCAATDCEGSDCTSSQCMGDDCEITTECSGPDCMTAPGCTTPECVDASTAITTIPSATAAADAVSSTSSTCTSTLVTSTCTSTLVTSTSSSTIVAADPTASATATMTCDSTDSALCPQNSCQGEGCNDTTSNHMPGGPHMPTYSQIPTPGDSSDIPTCGSANWVMGMPCDCPAGTYMQQSTSAANWNAPASELSNVTGDFWSTAWTGASPDHTTGSGAGNTIGDERSYSAHLPGSSKAFTTYTEKLVKYQRNADGGFSMTFGFSSPISFAQDDGTSGLIGASWDTMDVMPTGSDSCQMVWQTTLCSSHHADLSGMHESAMQNLTSILHDMGSLPGGTSDTDVMSM